jgi:hypothetical protein
MALVMNFGSLNHQILVIASYYPNGIRYIDIRIILGSHTSRRIETFSETMLRREIDDCLMSLCNCNALVKLSEGMYKRTNIPITLSGEYEIKYYDKVNDHLQSIVPWTIKKYAKSKDARSMSLLQF